MSSISVVKAGAQDIDDILSITHQTIENVYPAYYPKGAVDFFLAHHNKNSVAEDVDKESVYLAKEGSRVVGTVTLSENDINRLFVLPEHQGNGYGGTLLDFAETELFKTYAKVKLSASFPSKAIYLKRGYKEASSHMISTENGDFLCYDLMEKKKDISSGIINFDSKKFVALTSSDNGEIDNHTVYEFFQAERTLWGQYCGGTIGSGILIGSIDDDNMLHFHYRHTTKKGAVRLGKARSTATLNADNRIELHESWQWLNGDCSSGESVLIEV